MVNKKFKTIDDIERERREKEREVLRQNISRGMKNSQVFLEDFIKSLNNPPPNKYNPPPSRLPKRNSKVRTITNWLLYLLLFLFLITAVLGFAWLLRALIKSLFLGG